MDPFSIISLIFSVIMTGAEIASQVSTNRENQHNQQQLLQQQQNYSTQAAATANETSAQQYLNLYSPQAKVEQLDKAGLSVGLMYGQGGASGTGTTAAQAATPAAQAPIMNPAIQAGQSNNIMNMLKTITEAQRTKEETKNEEKKGREIEANIGQILQNTKKLEEETKTNVVTRNYQEIQVKLADNELKFQNATLNERIDIVKENLKLLQNNNEKTRNEIEVLDIEKEYKPKLYQSQLDLNEETKKKIVNEQAEVVAKTALAKAQEALAKAQEKKETEQANYISKQATELQKKLDQIELFGWKAIEGNGWVDTIIGLVEGLMTTVYQILTGEEPDPDYYQNGQHKDPNVHGGGGTW